MKALPKLAKVQHPGIQLDRVTFLVAAVVARFGEARLTAAAANIGALVSALLEPMPASAFDDAIKDVPAEWAEDKRQAFVAVLTALRDLKTPAPATPAVEGTEGAHGQ